MHNIKLVFSDLDGVLLSNGQISEEAIEKINKLTSRGVLFCIASGRTLDSAEKIVLRKLKIYFILENGSIIGDNLKGKIERYEEWYSNIKKDIPEVKRLQKIFSEKYKIIEKEMMFTITSDKDIKIPDGFDGVSEKRNKEVIDLFPISAGKENAAKFLLNKLGINLSETLSIGDSLNDLELLKITGFCACPSNSDKEIKDLVRSKKGIISEFEETRGVIDIFSRYFKEIL